MENLMSANKMASVSTELPRYECHKTVWALQLKDIRLSAGHHVSQFGGTWDSSSCTWELIPIDDKYLPITISHELFWKHQPKIGWYYVVYADGYQSFSPSQQFESGYTLVSNMKE